MKQGRIVNWNDSEGYGFIEMLGHAHQVFFHISAIQNQNRRPKVNDSVKFTLTEQPNGKLKAERVTITRSQLISTNGLIGVLLVVCLAISAIYLNGIGFIAALYLLMSGITYIAYALDKNAAVKGSWRTPESSLHLLSLCCGWPGALLAQQRLRHKSQKQPFKTILWLTIVANIIGASWLFGYLGIS